jgi:cytochrome o ubiquinol oxidase subunit 2
LRTGEYRRQKASYIVPLTLVLHGCTNVHWPLLHPAGPVALDERNLILWVTGLMLLVVIPVFVMTFGFIWRYRASNGKAVYAPEWAESPRLSLLFWSGPGLIVLLLGAIAWVSSHRLSPYEPMDTAVAPLTVEVIALDWKWLFIYPDLGVASLNRLVLPVDVPVDFRITSDTVMNSFFIPRLGGQIYAMAGMETQLHLMADQPGTWFGENTQYSGRGFPYQFFPAQAMEQAEFEAWVKSAQGTQRPLDQASYKQLARPGVRSAAVTFAPVQARLFETVMEKYMDTDAATGARHAREPEPGK